MPSYNATIGKICIEDYFTSEMCWAIWNKVLIKYASFSACNISSSMCSMPLLCSILFAYPLKNMSTDMVYQKVCNKYIEFDAPNFMLHSKYKIKDH